MKPIWKLLAVSALTAFFAVGSGNTASTDSYLRYQVAGPSSLCGCCPQSCGGGTYVGCWSSVNHPDNAVTCIYASGSTHFNCLSCMVSASATEAELSPAQELP